MATFTFEEDNIISIIEGVIDRRMAYFKRYDALVVSVLDPFDGLITVDIPALGTTIIDPTTHMTARPGNRFNSFQTPEIGDTVEVYFPDGDEDICRYSAIAPTAISVNGGLNKIVIFELDAVKILYDKTTAQLTIANGASEIILKTTGDILFNSGTAKIDVIGEVTAKAVVPAVAVKLSTHMHPSAVPGPPSSPTPGT